MTDGAGSEAAVTEISLAERKKARTRRELAAAAGRLFVERGYDATTIDDIAAAVEVSPRTFFRYFRGKEDVVTALGTTSMEDVAAGLAARPADEPLPEALREAVAAAMGPGRDEPEQMRGFLAMIDATPALRGRWLEQARHGQDLLADALAARLPDADRGRLQVTAGAVIAAVNTALSDWAHTGAGDPLDAVDRALQVLTTPLL